MKNKLKFKTKELKKKKFFLIEKRFKAIIDIMKIKINKKILN